GVGAAAGVVQLVGAVAREGEAVAVALGGILDGIPQAASLADDGRGAVAAGHHLGQAAGLALGGHQEAVCAGVDLLSQGAVEADVGAHTAGPPGGQVGEEALILALAAAQDHQLDAQVHQAVGDALDQVEALHGHHAADYGKDGAAVLVQAELVLQGGLAGCRAEAEVGGGGVGGDGGLGGRGGGVHVDAVEDAAQLILLLPQQGVQAIAERGVQDLLGVGGADGGDLVGGLEGALHEVGAAVVLDDVLVAPADAAGIFQDIQAILALVSDVVDGEDGLDPVELVQVTVVQVQVDRDQGRLPVVAVDDVGGEVQIEQGLQH